LKIDNNLTSALDLLQSQNLRTFIEKYKYPLVSELNLSMKVNDQLVQPLNIKPTGDYSESK
jgi:hypothetical protein